MIVKNKHNLIKYFILWIIFALLQILSIYSVSALPLELLIADTLARSVLLIPAGVLIYYVVKYAKYEKIQLTQQIVNYVVLALISISLWLLLGYAIDYLLAGGELTQKLVNILPFYIFTGFMFYLILILFFENKIILSKSAENIEKNINKSENNTRENHTQSAPNTEILERIAVKSGQKIHVVSVSDILYLQAFGDYIHIFTIDGKYLKEQTMKYFENNLPLQFVRVHRSYIVNVESISRIELYERQNHLLTLKNGHQIKISITGYKLLKQKLNL